MEIDKSKQMLKGDIVKMVGVERDKTRGRNVSGRSWKVRVQKRASTLTKTSHNNTSCKSWQARVEAKQRRKEIAELQNSIKEEKKQQAIAKKERRLENEKRKAENEYNLMKKSAQTLNPNKVGITLKAMSKKQLRQIKKTRLNSKTGVIEYVPAYSK